MLVKATTNPNEDRFMSIADLFTQYAIVATVRKSEQHGFVLNLKSDFINKHLSFEIKNLMCRSDLTSRFDICLNSYNSENVFFPFSLLNEFTHLVDLGIKRVEDRPIFILEDMIATNFDIRYGACDIIESWTIIPEYLKEYRNSYGKVTSKRKYKKSDNIIISEDAIYEDIYK